MPRHSHLVDAFTASAWNLHQPVYDRLSDLLEAHLLGRKAAWRDAMLLANTEDDDDDPASRQTPESWDIARDHVTEAGVAVIAVRGVLARHADEVNGACQPRGRSYQTILAQLAAAQADPQVRAVALVLETPGGQAAGCQEVADAIRASSKPVHAVIDGYCYSAGYYLASACESVIASSTSASLGSIGTIISFWDTSRIAEDQKVRRVVVRSSPQKAPIQPGEAVGEAALAELRREVDAYAAAFYDAVTLGRGLTAEQAAAVCNGRCWLAAEAQGLGLVDQVASVADALTAIAAAVTTTPATTGATMFGFPKKPQATADAAGLTKAELSALLAEFPASAERIAALDADGKTAAEITLDLLRERAAQAQDDAAKARADLAEATTAHRTREAELQATIDSLTAQTQAQQQWQRTVSKPGDPGAEPAPEAGATTAESVLAIWRGDPELRGRYALGGLASYLESLRLSGVLSESSLRAVRADLIAAKAF